MIVKGVIESDGELQSDDLNLILAEAIRDAGPWGQGFVEPTFDGEFEVVDWRVVGEKHLKMNYSQRMLNSQFLLLLSMCRPLNLKKAKVLFGRHIDWM